MKTLRQNFDLVILALVVSGFILIAAQRLGDVPVPNVDESYMLQTSYEMLYRGKLALPLRRFLGGNIENTWHSFTPLHYVTQTSWFGVFGWGIAQGRAFNLATAVLVLVMTYLIGRKLFDWRAALIAVGLIVCDVSFLERSRYLRNDFSAAMFALLSFFLYEAAERRKSWRLFVGAGLAAGAALMCHPAALYIFAAIPLLMLLRHGWQIIKGSSLYLFALGSFIVSAYEIIYDIIDWNNVLLQYRGDRRHFRLLEVSGWLANIKREPLRYLQWYDGDMMYPDVPRSLAHVFQYLTIAAIAYLIILALIRIRRGGALSDARVRLLIVTTVIVTFFAVVASQKAGYYMAHLRPWFALAVGIMLTDALDALSRNWSRLPKLSYAAVIAGALIFAGAFSYHALKTGKRYLRNVLDPDVARFEEVKTAIRSLVPEGVCPVEVRDPVMWLAFPEHDRCFAYLQERMTENVDIDGNEYALIVEPTRAHYWLQEVANNHNYPLGDLRNTPYGDFQVYYTGTNPRWLGRAPIHYQFFGKRRGYVSDAQVANASEVWSASPTQSSECAQLGESVVDPEGLLVEKDVQGSRDDGFIKLCSIELKSDTVYQVVLDANSEAGDGRLLVVEEKTGVWLQEKAIGNSDQTTKEFSAPRVFDGVFRTGRNSRVTLGILPRTKRDAGPFRISRISIREVLSARSEEQRSAS